MNALAKLASKVLATPVVAAPVRGLALSAGELSSILEDRISSYYTESDGASVAARNYVATLSRFVATFIIPCIKILRMQK